MRRLHLHEIALPLTDAFTNAVGTVTERRTIIVGIGDGDHTGWGEAAPYPGVTDDTVETVWASLIRNIAPVLDDRPNELTASAAAAVDEARQDLAAREAGVPLWRQLGGTRPVVTAGLAVGMGDVPAVVAAVGEAVELGISAFKLKIAPGSDVKPLRALRSTFPGISLAADANGAYTGDDPLFDELDELGLAYIEQPLGITQIHEHAVLRQRIETPICIDEGAAPTAMAMRIVETGAADIVCVKPARVGLTDGVAIVERAATAGMGVKVSGMFESSIGKAHTLALATRREVEHVDLAPVAAAFTRQIVTEPTPLLDGGFAPPEGPGIGLSPDPDLLADVSVRAITLNR